MRTCPSSSWGTSLTWRTVGRCRPMRRRCVLISGVWAMWRPLPRLVPMWTRYEHNESFLLHIWHRLQSLKKYLNRELEMWLHKSVWVLKLYSPCIDRPLHLAGVFRLDAWNKSKKNGRQQREEWQEEEEEFGKENSRAMLHSIMTGWPVLVMPTSHHQTPLSVPNRPVWFSHHPPICQGHMWHLLKAVGVGRTSSKVSWQFILSTGSGWVVWIKKNWILRQKKKKSETSWRGISERHINRWIFLTCVVVQHRDGKLLLLKDYTIYVFLYIYIKLLLA